MRRTATVALTFGLIAAACGGSASDGSSTSSSSAESTVVTTTLPTTTTTTAPTTTTASLDDRLVAYYPLTADLSDATGLNADLAVSNAPLDPVNGIYCNGGYRDELSCQVNSPQLSGLHLDSFTISAEFLIPDPWPISHPLFVGGRAFRWMGVYLNPDASIELLYNNSERVECTGEHAYGVWHEAAIAYDGSTATLYLDGTAICATAIARLEHGDDRNLSVSDYGGGYNFSGFIRELKVYGELVTPEPSTAVAGIASRPDNLSLIDKALATCPTAEEVASVDAALAMIFDSFPGRDGPLVCTDAEGSRNFTRFQRSAYNVILVMRQLEFDAPLPWTDLSLYDWFVGAVSGLRFREDIENSFCCDPAGVINIATIGKVMTQTDRWIQPGLNSGLADTLGLFIHEGRHADGLPHTCAGTEDATLEELGAWGVQHYLFAWLAEHADQEFQRAGDIEIGRSMIERSESALTRICG